MVAGQQGHNFRNAVFLALNTQDFIAVIKVEIPMVIWNYLVDVRLKFLNLVFCLD